MSGISLAHCSTTEPPPSDWVVRWCSGLTPGARVLDVACGSGRHTRWLAAQGHQVTAVDRDAQALSGLQAVAEVIVADLEQGPWPLPLRVFDAVVVTHYLWRPLWPVLRQALAPAGRLVYETFAQGQAQWGRPRRPEFLLQPGELLLACQGMHILAYEDGLLHAPTRRIQRLCAVHADASASDQLSLNR